MSVLESFSNKLKIGTLLNFDVWNTKIIISESEEKFIKSSYRAEENVASGVILKKLKINKMLKKWQQNEKLTKNKLAYTFSHAQPKIPLNGEKVNNNDKVYSFDI